MFETASQALSVWSIGFQLEKICHLVTFETTWGQVLLSQQGEIFLALMWEFQDIAKNM